MKNFDLNAYGVIEMSQQEVVAVNGGSVLVGILIMAALLGGVVAFSVTAYQRMVASMQTLFIDAVMAGDIENAQYYLEWLNTH